MKMQKVEDSVNEMGLKGCIWSSLGAQWFILSLERAFPLSLSSVAFAPLALAIIGHWVARTRISVGALFQTRCAETKNRNICCQRYQIHSIALNFHYS